MDSRFPAISIFKKKYRGESKLKSGMGTLIRSAFTPINEPATTSFYRDVTGLSLHRMPLGHSSWLNP